MRGACSSAPGCSSKRPMGRAAATASSGRTSSTWPPATSAWIHRSGARCCAARSTRRWWWTPRPAAASTSSWRSSTRLRGAAAAALPDDAHVLELPRIALVDVLGKQPLALVQRRPVGVLPDHRPEVRHADLEVAAEIQLVGLDDALVGILHGPYHP